MPGRVTVQRLGFSSGGFKKLLELCLVLRGNKRKPDARNSRTASLWWRSWARRTIDILERLGHLRGGLVHGDRRRRGGELRGSSLLLLLLLLLRRLLLLKLRLLVLAREARLRRVLRLQMRLRQVAKSGHGRLRLLRSGSTGKSSILRLHWSSWKPSCLGSQAGLREHVLLLLLRGLLLSERRGLWLLLLAWAATGSAAQERIGGGVHLKNRDHHSYTEKKIR